MACLLVHATWLGVTRGSRGCALGLASSNRTVFGTMRNNDCKLMRLRGRNDWRKARGKYSNGAR